MYRSPIAIALAVVSAVLMLVGRVNHGAPWGDWVFIAGIALLVVAGVLNFLLDRRRRSRQ
jgi:hypothetical protein